ncbi:MAG: DUF349 domain-containing protein [Bacteroidales bacterium]|nr:DUF349 domain-containing protein [Bacteroidales bacterium]
MSEQLNPEVLEQVLEATDVPQAPSAETPAQQEEQTENTVNYAEMSLAELAAAFEELAKSEDRMRRTKEADAIKSAFYKKLSKAKADAGLAPVEETPYEAEEEEAVQEEVAQPQNPFEQVEMSFKAFYNAYKKERAEYNKQLEMERESNLKLKEEVIADLKALLEKGEDVNATFPEFRKIQDRWRAIGPVPATAFRNINDTYQLYVEQFYDMVSINRELRDLDFKKNLEAKQKFCEIAEKLAENDNVVDAFKELQKLHEQWKEFGPVAKQYREEIWDRFKAATATVNKKYQAFFEGMKEKQSENLAAKTALCERVEAIAAKGIASSNEWNACSKEIEEIQKEWRGIGFASKKDNQKIYDRFRAACDAFYARKREFYTDYKDNINSNLEKKISICEAAEALKSSTEWKKASDQFIALQKQWKEIGAVPRKKSAALWKRFRAACDEFFAEHDKQAKPENDFYGNLRAKQRLVEEIKAFELSSDESENVKAMNEFAAKWQAIGFVPFKEKDAINQAYKEAVASKFAGLNARRPRRGGAAPAPRSLKDQLVQKYNKLEQDIITYENNIGFFAKSKNSDALVGQIKERIAQAKEELASLKEQIRAAQQEENKEQE